MEKQHCLLIADDLTGGADAGAQFAKRGLKTLLVPFRGEGDPLAARPAQDVLVMGGLQNHFSCPQLTQKQIPISWICWSRKNSPGAHQPALGCGSAKGDAEIIADMV